MTLSLTPLAINDIFGDEGMLSFVLPGFQPRVPQVEMAQTVAHALLAEENGIIEAGTGTGKSLAYLIPGIIHALTTKTRLLISTNTINLQEQILDKDLPVVKALGIEFRAILIKGRGNYICLRKLSMQNISHDSALLTDDQRAFARLAQWIGFTKTGSRSDVEFRVAPEMWEEVQSESDTCQNRKCSYYRDCFFFKSRKDANEADVLVVNHALLCTDLAIRSINDESNGLIPEYAVATIDEAHNLETAATNHIGFKFAHRQFVKNLQRIYTYTNNREYGKLPMLAQRVQLMPTIGNLAQQDILNRLEGVRLELMSFTAEYAELANKVFHALEYQERKRIQHGDQCPVALQEIIHFLLQRGRQMQQMTASALSFTAMSLEDDEYLSELQAYVNRFAGYIDAIDQFTLWENSTLVQWYVLDRENFQLVTSPLDVAPILRETLFNRVKSAFLVSATLAVGDSMKYVEKQLGFVPQHERILPSPFDYARNANIILPRLPEFDARLPSNDQKNISRLIAQVAHALGGGVFVLFTSQLRLRKVAEELRPNKLPCELYVQGELPRHELLRRFREGTPAVLLGLASFWEGVDVKGENLRCVMIEKLPFPVPDEPLFAARCEAATRDGKSPFMELSIPQAVIRFKQGFGRLIRDENDRGSCIVCDSRILNRRYGKIFLRSLPVQQPIACEPDEVVQHLLR